MGKQYAMPSVTFWMIFSLDDGSNGIFKRRRASARTRVTTDRPRDRKNAA